MHRAPVLFAPKPFATSLPGGIEAKLTSNQAPDGSVVLLTVELPATDKDSGAGLSGKLLSKDRDSGESMDFSLLFYPLPGKGTSAYQAVIGVPFNSKLGPTSIALELGKGAQARTFSLPFTIIDGQYPSERIPVSNKFVNPSADEMARIDREQAELGELYRNLRREKLWNGPFKLPINAPVTGVFGTRRVFNGVMKSFHRGVDLKASSGTPIHAAADGVVVLAKDLFFSGNTVIVEHGYGIFTHYMHMSALKAKTGAQVKQGEVLGLVGMTGRATGPHLHWGAVIQDAKINPLDLTRVLQ